MKFTETDLTNLESIGTEFIDESLKTSFADLLCRIPIGEEADEKRSNYFFFLFEHKSYNDPMVSYQAARYITRIMKREEQQGKRGKKFKLPFVLPIVFHHGSKNFFPGLESRDLTLSFSPIWKLRTSIPIGAAVISNPAVNLR